MHKNNVVYLSVELINQSFSILADKRIHNGGARKGAGRKPKNEEQDLIEKLTPLAPKAFKALENAIDDEHNWAVKLWFEYMYGKPTEKVEVTKRKDRPIIDVE